MLTNSKKYNKQINNYLKIEQIKLFNIILFRGEMYMNNKTYTVKKGDTLYGISKQFNTSAQK